MDTRDPRLFRVVDLAAWIAQAQTLGQLAVGEDLARRMLQGLQREQYLALARQRRYELIERNPK